jgi:predicted dehydrogenase
MNRGNLSRRGFMQRSIAAMVATGLPGWYAQELFAAQEKKAADDKKPVDANDKILMGSIGLGPPPRRGRDLLNAARKEKGVQYIAVCDVDKSHREYGAKEIGGDCKMYEDFRQLLDNKDINAVTIAVPDHWHALIAIEAMKKGKDVYCEKPLALTIGEGRAIATVHEKTGRVFQTGSQQRTEFGGRFRLAARLVRAGRLGKIKTIETRIDGNPPSPSIPKADPPDGLNWEFWLGPAPKVDFCLLKEGTKVFTRGHYEFRWWYEYSGGKMTDWGAHHNDIAQWALNMDKSGPIEVEGKGDPPSDKPNSYNCHPHFTVNYLYSNGTQLICKSKGENGVRFEGEDGKWIFVSRGKIEASDKAILEEKLPDSADKLNEATSQMGNFIECVRTRKPTVCPAEVGHRSATVCHIGVISTRLGKKLKWDPVKERFHDEEADKWLLREFRKPWKLEV